MSRSPHAPCPFESPHPTSSPARQRQEPIWMSPCTTPLTVLVLVTRIAPLDSVFPSSLANEKRVCYSSVQTESALLRLPGKVRLWSRTTLLRGGGGSAYVGPRTVSTGRRGRRDTEAMTEARDPDRYAHGHH